MVHRFWVGPPQPGEQWITQAVKKAHAEATLSSWTLESLPAELTEILNPNDDPVHLSNLVRYWVLHRYGGLWLDHDVIPFRNLTGAPRPWTASLRGQREPAVMWFPAPGHRLLNDLFAVGLHGDPAQRSPDRSGAHLLHRLGAAHKDVGFEPRVFPIDAVGRPMAITEVWAVHLWQRSSLRYKPSG